MSEYPLDVSVGGIGGDLRGGRHRENSSRWAAEDRADRMRFCNIAAKRAGSARGRVRK